MEKKQELQSIRKRLETWRSQPGHPGPGKKIPEDLWDDILALVPHLSLGTISRELKLNWETLKQRASGFRRSRHPKARKRASPSFKATFTVAKVGDLIHKPQSLQVAIVRPDGCTMTIHSDTEVDLENLVSTFCSGGK